VKRGEAKKTHHHLQHSRRRCFHHCSVVAREG
jgi:hypothetical protein